MSIYFLDVCVDSRTLLLFGHIVCPHVLNMCIFVLEDDQALKLISVLEIMSELRGAERRGFYKAISPPNPGLIINLGLVPETRGTQ